MKLPPLNKMRDAQRKSNEVITRYERMEKRQKQRLTWKKIISIVILALIVVPIKSEDARLAHGIVTVCAIVAWCLLHISQWRSRAPLTRYRILKQNAIAAGICLLFIPFVLMLIDEEITSDNWQLYYLLWGCALLALVGYLVGRIRYRRIKSETADEVERIRRREQRRKRMEML